MTSTYFEISLLKLVLADYLQVLELHLFAISQNVEDFNAALLVGSEGGYSNPGVSPAVITKKKNPPFLSRSFSLYFSLPFVSVRVFDGGDSNQTRHLQIGDRGRGQGQSWDPGLLSQELDTFTHNPPGFWKRSPFLLYSRMGSGWNEKPNHLEAQTKLKSLWLQSLLFSSMWQAADHSKLFCFFFSFNICGFFSSPFPFLSFAALKV